MNRKITTSIIAQAKVMKQNGKTLKEIAAELGVNKYTIQFYLKDVPSPNNKKLTDEQKEKIVALTKNGLSTYQIADKLEISQKTVCHILKKSLAKEKEPATAATVTDSEVKDEKENVSANSFSNNNTDTAKSQGLSPFTALTLLEVLLDNWVGNEYEKEYMQAYKNAAALIFMYKGRKYSFQFQECKEDSGE